MGASKYLLPLALSLSHGSKEVSTATSLGLTFAGLHALKPAMTHVFVVDSSAILVPITTRSATAHSPGLLERATVCTHGDVFLAERCGDWCARYFPSR